MKNFLLGMAFGTAVGYMFHGDIDKALKQGLAKANEAAGTPTSVVATP